MAEEIDVPELTLEEEKAIVSLQRLAKKWPQDLTLFSWSGTLMIFKRNSPTDKWHIIENIYGIPNDGGDPSANEVIQ